MYIHVRVLDSGVIGSWELTRRFWELNPGPLEGEQSVLLTTEPSLQPSPLFFIIYYHKYHKG